MAHRYQCVDLSRVLYGHDDLSAQRVVGADILDACA
jgi:hypothetical protein